MAINIELEEFSLDNIPPECEMRVATEFEDVAVLEDINESGRNRHENSEKRLPESGTKRHLYNDEQRPTFAGP